MLAEREHEEILGSTTLQLPVTLVADGANRLPRIDVQADGSPTPMGPRPTSWQRVKSAQP